MAKKAGSSKGKTQSTQPVPSKAGTPTSKDVQTPQFPPISTKESLVINDFEPDKIILIPVCLFYQPQSVLGSLLFKRMHSMKVNASASLNLSRSSLWSLRLHPRKEKPFGKTVRLCSMYSLTWILIFLRSYNYPVTELCRHALLRPWTSPPELSLPSVESPKEGKCKARWCLVRRSTREFF